MKERPILFSAPMVRAILDGRKTQTRRVVKPRKDWLFGVPLAACEIAGEINQGRYSNCVFGEPSDRLWVRESFRFADSLDRYSPTQVGEVCVDAGYKRPWAPTVFEADGTRANWEKEFCTPGMKTAPGRLRASMHMPRWASRITLEITAVRVERLQDITAADAVAEGMSESVRAQLGHSWEHVGEAFNLFESIDTYRLLWNKINGPGSWDKNPWVWVVEFRRVES